MNYLTLPVDYTTYRNPANGGIELTNNSLDVAINGPGYFAITTPNGTRYTRRGDFHIDVTGTLSTSSGDKVQSIDGGDIIITEGSVS